MLPSTIYPSCSTPFLKFVEGSGSEVFLDNAVLADDEGPHSGNPVLCGRSYHGKAAHHHSFDDGCNLTVAPHGRFRRRGLRQAP